MYYEILNKTTGVKKMRLSCDDSIEERKRGECSPGMVWETNLLLIKQKETRKGSACSPQFTR